MKAVLEFVGYFRMKTGCGFLEAEFKDEDVTILDLIVQAEEILSARDFKVLSGMKLKDGVLLFIRNENGGLKRIFKLSTALREIGEHVIMANLMGGG